ncbi:MAG: hypothetical protein SWE60_06810 [Thermodesulfobacteriota bacterium]|nr:hypothetical protein [Thermodesulfobacteriota bacterium]
MTTELGDQKLAIFDDYGSPGQNTGLPPIRNVWKMHRFVKHIGVPLLWPCMEDSKELIFFVKEGNGLLGEFSPSFWELQISLTALTTHDTNSFHHVAGAALG